jgi:hypothetical protein
MAFTDAELDYLAGRPATGGRRSEQVTGLERPVLGDVDAIRPRR